jgi:hypothetical protein
MDKTVLRNFAIESRRDLMEKIDRKIKLFYVDEEFKKDNRGDVIVLSNDKHTLTLTKDEDFNRDKLIHRICELGYDKVVEEAAYTWFNRIIAIRYMEIHDFLPLSKNNLSLGIRVLSSSDGTLNPEILKFSNLSNPELDINIDINKYSQLKTEDEKFKYVLLHICDKLGIVVPQVFAGITDYIDLLIPDNMLNDNGFISNLILKIDEDNFKQVEIIGWLYQYYNQLEKDRVISSKKQVKKDEIAYVTQLFTPDWIVRYMTENSLGRFWIEKCGGNDNNDWKYLQRSNIMKESNSMIDPKDIKFIDPCSGSGHILVYAFELLYSMYMDYGYNKNDIPSLILANNLYGLDIDDRAGQLSILSVLLKAREYDKNIFNKKIIEKMNVMSIQESNAITDSILDLFNDSIKDSAKKIIDNYLNAKEIGSLIIPINDEFYELENALEKEQNIFAIELKNKLLPLIKLNRILLNKYDVVVTNPPYMNQTSMSNVLKEYIKIHFSDYKADLFSSFVVKNSMMLKDDSYLGFMTPMVWMFISSYEQLRQYIIDNLNIFSLIHLEYSALEEATVPICTFVLDNKKNKEKGIYYRLSNFTGGMKIQEEKYLELLNSENSSYVFEKDINDFKKIPSLPIAYWVGDGILNTFNNKTIGDLFEVKQGMTTGNNNMFLRYWYEVEHNKIGFGLDTNEAKESKYKWFPYNKGGEYRKWFGNQEYVVNYENDGFEMKEYTSHLPQGTWVRLKSREYYFKEAITWSFISSSKFGVRYSPQGFIFDVAGSSLFANDKTLYTLGILGSNYAFSVLQMLNPTLNYQTKDIKSIPYIEKNVNEVEDIVRKNIEISRKEWNDYETSWDFKKNPLILENSLIEDRVIEYKKNRELLFNELKSNEEKLNSIINKIYDVENEVDNKVDDKDITLRSIDELSLIKSLISYAVGCMFGRYSLNEEGLKYAGGIYNSNEYKRFIPDVDNIIPISDSTNVFYNDDIVGKFRDFIAKAFGDNNVNKNIEYIAEVLGKKGTETSEETIRRYFVNDFYNEHTKIYQKRPIYWLFDSGKKNGFKCLIYLHRYDEQIVSKIRTKYLHNTISIYQRELDGINFKLNNEELSISSKRELQNKKAELTDKILECNKYDEMIGNVANKMIKLNLDDGVAINYSKFVDDNGKSVLARIK